MPKHPADYAYSYESRTGHVQGVVLMLPVSGETDTYRRKYHYGEVRLNVKNGRLNSISVHVDGHNVNYKASHIHKVTGSTEFCALFRSLLTN